MKRILINARFLTQPVSGVQRCARELVRALPAGAATFALVAPRGAGEGPAGIELIRDDSILSGHLWEQLRLPHWVRSWNADLLWSPCNTGPLRVERQVVSIYDASVFAGPQWFTFAFGATYRWLLPRLGSRALRVVTHSRFSRDELVKYGVADEAKIRVTPLGVGPPFGVRTLERERVILFVGSLDPRKNIHRLAEALSLLKEKRTLTLVGGSVSQVFRSLGLDEFFDMHPLDHVPDIDLADLYAKADLLVLPSLYEGFGLPALEAMASGTPVVVSRAASLPELCGDAAVYCDPNSVEDIAQAIKEALKDTPERKQRIELGLEIARRFTWERAAAALVRVFEEV